MSEASQSPASESPATAPSVVMLSGDLMFASRVKAAAERAGFDFRIGGALPADNTDAIRFYERLGAVQMDEWTVNRVTGEALEELANIP